MCFGGTPKMPKQEDPVLPKQPLQPQQPVGLSVGRGDDDDNKFKMAKAKRNRGKLRIAKTSDRAGVQVPGAGGRVA